jgi:hypothetical protein
MRVRLDLTHVSLGLGTAGTVGVRYNVVLLTEGRESVISAIPEPSVLISDPTRELFERATAALSRDLSASLGIGFSDELGSEEDLLDDPEILDEPDEEDEL